jgi:hypothetical protein
VIDIYLGVYETCFDECYDLARAQYGELNQPEYGKGVSILKLPNYHGFENAWLTNHNTLRKRANKAKRIGYRVERVEPAHYPGDIEAINRSLGSRQGRPMSDSYTDGWKPATSLIGDPQCPQHHRAFYGVLSAFNALVGYISAVRCGEVVVISMLLGHGEYLNDGIMYLAMRELVRDQLVCGTGYVFYNRHDSGTPGLRWFKERLGFAEEDVTWKL